MKMSLIPIAVSALGTVPKGLKKKNEELENQRQNRDHTDHSTVEVSQNGERPAVKTSVKNSQ